MKILFVEDEEDFSTIMSQYMDNWGHEVVSILNPQEAIDLLESDNMSFDVLLLDYMMPSMNGIELLKELRDAGIETPAIMFTSYPEKTSLQSVESLNVVALVPKLSSHGDTTTMLKSALNIVAKGK